MKNQPAKRVRWLWTYGFFSLLLIYEKIMILQCKLFILAQYERIKQCSYFKTPNLKSTITWLDEQNIYSVYQIYYYVVKEAIAPIFTGCGILLLNPHIILYFAQTNANQFRIVVLSITLILTALVYLALYIDKLWGKKDYRMVKRSIYLMIFSIVLCSAIVVLTMKLFPIQFVAWFLIFEQIIQQQQYF